MFVEDYSFELLRRGELAPVKKLGGVTGGSVTGSLHADIRWAGSFTITGSEARETNWGKYWIRISHVSYMGKDKKITPVGVFTPVSVKTHDSRTEGEYSQEITFCDLTTVPHEAKTVYTYTITSGTPIGEAVERLLERSGQTVHLVDRSLGALRSTLTWEPQTPRLKIINDILDAAGCFALYATRDGVLRAAKYLPPRQRAVKYDFTERNITPIHIPDMDYDSEITRANEIICISSSTGGKKALTAVARNENPASPFSYQSLGRWISETYTGIEVSGQEALQIHADRKLSTGTAGRLIERRMLFTDLDLNDTVQGGNLETVENLRIDFTPGSLMSVQSREVGL